MCRHRAAISTRLRPQHLDLQLRLLAAQVLLVPRHQGVGVRLLEDAESWLWIAVRAGLLALVPEISDQAGITGVRLLDAAVKVISRPFHLTGFCWLALGEADVLCLLWYFVMQHSQREDPLFC